MILEKRDVEHTTINKEYMNMHLYFYYFFNNICKRHDLAMTLKGICVNRVCTFCLLGVPNLLDTDPQDKQLITT